MGFDFKHIVWTLLMAVSMVLFFVAFTSPTWIESKVKGLEDRSCGMLAYQVKNDDVKYGSFDDIPIMWWQICVVCIGIGAATLILTLILSFVTMIPAFHTYQTYVHNTTCLACVVIFIGQIFFCVGFKDMETSNTDALPCNICADGTTAFVLKNCDIGEALIINIIAIIIVAITCCVGFTVDHGNAYHA